MPVFDVPLVAMEAETARQSRDRAGNNSEDRDITGNNSEARCTAWEMGVWGEGVRDMDKWERANTCIFG